MHGEQKVLNSVDTLQEKARVFANHISSCHPSQIKNSSDTIKAMAGHLLTDMIQHFQQSAFSPAFKSLLDLADEEDDEVSTEHSDKLQTSMAYSYDLMQTSMTLCSSGLALQNILLELLLTPHPMMTTYNFLHIILQTVSMIVDSSRYIQPHETKLVLKTIQFLYNLTVNFEPAKNVIFTILFISNHTETSFFPQSSSSPFTQNDLNELWSNLLVECDPTIATATQALIYSIFCDSTMKNKTQYDEDEPMGVYAWDTIEQDSNTPDTKEDGSTFKKAHESKVHHGVHALSLSVVRVSALQEFFKTSAGMTFANILCGSIFFRSLCRITTSTTRASRWVLNSLFDENVASDPTSSELLKFMSRELLSTTDHSQSLFEERGYFNVFSIIDQARDSQKASNSSHSVSNSSITKHFLALASRGESAARDPLQSTSVHGYLGKQEYAVNDKYSDVFDDDLDDIFSLAANASAGWFLPKSSTKVPQPASETEMDQSQYSEWFLSTGEVPTQSIWKTQCMHILVLLCPHLVSYLSQLSLACMSLVARSTVILHLYLIKDEYSDLHLKMGGRGDVDTHTVIQSLLQKTPTPTSVLRAARALVSVVNQLSICVDTAVSSLWAFSQLPPPEEPGSENRPVSISVPLSRSIWDTSDGDRKLQPTVSNVISNSGALFTFLSLLLQNHGALLSSYPSIVTSQHPLQTSDVVDVNVTVSNKRQLEVRPFIEYPKSHIEKVNERVLYFLHPAIHALATASSLMSDDEDYFRSQTANDSDCSAVIPFWQHFLGTQRISHIPMKDFTFLYTLLSAFDSTLFPIYDAPLNQNETDIPSIIQEYCFLEPFASLDQTTKLHDFITSCDCQSLDQRMAFERSDEYSSIVSSTAIFLGLLKSLQTCTIIDTASVTGDGTLAISQEAAVLRGDITEEEMLQTPGEQKSHAINRSPMSFKVDVIQALANLSCVTATEQSFEKPNIEEVRSDSFQTIPGQSLLGAASALELCLSHSRMDSHNPFIREWSILATKNLTEKHYGNQSRVAALSLVGVEHNEDLQRIGVDVWSDNGKVKIARNDPNESLTKTTVETPTPTSTPTTATKTTTGDGNGSVQYVSTVDDMLSELKEEYQLNIDDFM